MAPIFCFTVWSRFWGGQGKGSRNLFTSWWGMAFIKKSWIIGKLKITPHFLWEKSKYNLFVWQSFKTVVIDKIWPLYAHTTKKTLNTFLHFVTGDTDFWQVTHDADMCNVTSNTWQLTCDTWHTGDGEHSVKIWGP